MKNVLIAGTRSPACRTLRLGSAVLGRASDGFEPRLCFTLRRRRRARQAGDRTVADVDRASRAPTCCPTRPCPSSSISDRHLEGPVAMLFVRPEPAVQAMPPSTFGKGLPALSSLVGLLAAALLKMTSPAFAGFRPALPLRLSCASCLAVALTDLNGPIWWHNPPAFHVGDGALPPDRRSSRRRRPRLFSSPTTPDAVKRDLGQ